MTESISIDEFVQTYSSMQRDDVCYVDVGGTIPVPIKVSPVPGSDVLIVAFHGAVNRAKRSYPPFLNFREGLLNEANQVSVSDATLGLDDDLALAWYAGAPGLQLQSLLPPLFEKLSKAVGSRRTVFVGSSGGGFAALFYSWHLSGSAAVVQVPQTNAWRYHLPGALRRYQATCWPNGLDSNPLAPVLDLRDLYSVESNNSIVYIQSMMDTHHLHDQMVRFLASVPDESRSRIVVKSSFWGRMGHSNVVPLREWDGWLRAVLLADDLSAESIVTAYEDLSIESVPKVGKRTPTSQNPELKSTSSSSEFRSLNDLDLKLAEVVAQHQLNQD